LIIIFSNSKKQILNTCKIAEKKADEYVSMSDECNLYIEQSQVSYTIYNSRTAGPISKILSSFSVKLSLSAVYLFKEVKLKPEEVLKQRF